MGLCITWTESPAGIFSDTLNYEILRNNFAMHGFFDVSPKKMERFRKTPHNANDNYLGKVK